MMSSKPFLKAFIPVLLAIVYFVIGLASIKDRAHTDDESRHLVRGIMLLKTGDFRLNQHHPYLFNAINAIPAVLNPDLKTESLNNKNWKEAGKDSMADNLVRINGGLKDFSDNILKGPRISMILLSSAFIVIFYTIVNKLYGGKIALISSVFLTFDPTFLAHGTLVTTDAPSMFMMFLASIALVFYLRNQGKKKVIWASVFILLAFLGLLTKYNIVFILPIWLLIIFIERVRANKHGSIIKKYFNAFLLPFGICLVLFLGLFAAYGFKTGSMYDMHYGSKTREKNMIENIHKIPSKKIQSLATNAYYNLKMPFPQYINGFYENVFKHDIFGHNSYFLGEVKSEGSIFYFPVVFLIKEPPLTVISTLASIAIGIYIVIKNRKKEVKLEVLTLVLVPGFYFLLTINSSINLGIRHLAPVLPFVFIMIGIFFNKIYSYNQPLKFIIFAGTTMNILSVVMIHPFYIEYFNEFVCGPKNGYRLVRGSNLDWGQNDILVEEYLHTHKDATQSIKNFNSENRFLVISKEKLYPPIYKTTPEIKEVQEQYEDGKLTAYKRIGYTHLILRRK